MVPQHLKPYGNASKSYAADAEDNCEAVG